MRRMFAEQVAPRLARRFELRPLNVRTVKTFGIGESAVAEMVGDLLERPGPDVNAGIYARDDGVHLRFTTRGESDLLTPAADGARRALGEAVWGTDGDELGGVALAALGRAGVRTLSSWEADTQGSLLAILSAASDVDEGARYVGGVLDIEGAPSPPMADAVLQVSLLPMDAHGRSRVRVALSGALTASPAELRIHGSGAQRLRRAAFAALDHIRRSVAARLTG
jgi:nicotinamide-nucleotide amidase